MTRYEQEYYHNVKKISESLESIAHSLEIISETNIKINADIDSKELFKDEEDYYKNYKENDQDYSEDNWNKKVDQLKEDNLPFPEVEDSYDNSDYDNDN